MCENLVGKIVLAKQIVYLSESFILAVRRQRVLHPSRKKMVAHRCCIFPFLRDCRIVYKVQRVRRTSRVDTPVVKLRSLLSPTNLAGDRRTALPPTKIIERNRRGGSSIAVQRLHSDAGTAVQLLSLSPTGFHTRRKTAQVRGPGRAAVKAEPVEYRGGDLEGGTPNGRSIGHTYDNYYYRHPAIFRAGCKTARELR